MRASVSTSTHFDPDRVRVRRLHRECWWSRPSMMSRLATKSTHRTEGRCRRWLRRALRVSRACSVRRVARRCRRRVAHRSAIAKAGRRDFQRPTPAAHLVRRRATPTRRAPGRPMRPAAPALARPGHRAQARAARGPTRAASRRPRVPPTHWAGPPRARKSASAPTTQWPIRYWRVVLGRYMPSWRARAHLRSPRAAHRSRAMP